MRPPSASRCPQTAVRRRTARRSIRSLSRRAPGTDPSPLRRPLGCCALTHIHARHHGSPAASASPVRAPSAPIAPRAALGASCRAPR
eukprot:809639-Prymnesium_polylepis.1